MTTDSGHRLPAAAIRPRHTSVLAASRLGVGDIVQMLTGD